MDKKFTEQLLTILELRNAEPNENIVLRSGSWDSLAVLSIISLIDELYSVTVPGSQLRDCVTIGDINQLIQKAQAAEE